jgi:hypothetical protein
MSTGGRMVVVVASVIGSMVVCDWRPRRGHPGYVTVGKLGLMSHICIGIDTVRFDAGRNMSTARALLPGSMVRRSWLGTLFDSHAS